MGGQGEGCWGVLDVIHVILWAGVTMEVCWVGTAGGLEDGEADQVLGWSHYMFG